MASIELKTTNTRPDGHQQTRSHAALGFTPSENPLVTGTAGIISRNLGQVSTEITHCTTIGILNGQIANPDLINLIQGQTTDNTGPVITRVPGKHQLIHTDTENHPVFLGTNRGPGAQPAISYAVPNSEQGAATTHDMRTLTNDGGIYGQVKNSTQLPNQKDAFAQLPPDKYGDDQGTGIMNTNGNTIVDQTAGKLRRRMVSSSQQVVLGEVMTNETGEEVTAVYNAIGQDEDNNKQASLQITGLTDHPNSHIIARTHVAHSADPTLQNTAAVQATAYENAYPETNSPIGAPTLTAIRDKTTAYPHGIVSVGATEAGRDFSTMICEISAAVLEDGSRRLGLSRLSLTEQSTIAALLATSPDVETITRGDSVFTLPINGNHRLDMLRITANLPDTPNAWSIDVTHIRGESPDKTGDLGIFERNQLRLTVAPGADIVAQGSTQIIRTENITSQNGQPSIQMTELTTKKAPEALLPAADYALVFGGTIIRRGGDGLIFQSQTEDYSAIVRIPTGQSRSQIQLKESHPNVARQNYVDTVYTAGASRRFAQARFSRMNQTSGELFSNGTITIQ